MATAAPAQALPLATQIENVFTEALQPYASNPRKHSRKQVRQIANSIKEFGFNNPLLVDAANRVIAGHGRLEAAKLLGRATVPILRIEHLTEAQKRAYTIADNKLAENSHWDPALLTLEFSALLETDFDGQLTGFATAEIDKFVNPFQGDDDEYLPEVKVDEAPVSRAKDLWLLGEHRLYCGDSTLRESYEMALNGQFAQMVFTDPPYNVKIDGHVSGNGKVKHGEFAMASGEMSKTEFTAFLHTICQQLVAHSTDGSIHFICIDWRHIGELLDAAKPTFTEVKNLCVWNKDNGGMGSLYRSKHELVFVFKKGKAPHTNNVELGKHGRDRTNVWNYAGANSMRKGRQEKLAMHPTVKPVAMVADAIKDCSNRGDCILDAFGGSGSTLIAAHQTGRKAALIEFDPQYVDVTIRRFEKLYKVKAIHGQTKETFREMARQRAAETATVPANGEGGHD